MEAIQFQKLNNVDRSLFDHWNQGESDGQGFQFQRFWEIFNISNRSSRLWDGFQTGMWHTYKRLKNCSQTRQISSFN